MRRLCAFRLAVLTVLAGAAGLASACGLEDPNSVAMLRGVLQFAYPKALHVGTAVWQAQLAGTLPPDAIAQRAELSPEARASLRLLKANAQIGRLAGLLDAAPRTARPAVAIVFVGPVLWSRFEAGDGPVKAEVHVAGPKAGDVVVVTDVAVIEAITDGKMTVGAAVESGLLRLYGTPEDVLSARRWLDGSAS